MFSDNSSCVGASVFVQVEPVQLEHITVHGSPALTQLHLFVQLTLQAQDTTLISFSGAYGLSVLIGVSSSDSSNCHPQSVGCRSPVLLATLVLQNML